MGVWFAFWTAREVLAGLGCDLALAKVGVESSNLIARSIFRRLLSDLSPVFELGFGHLGRWGSGWGSETLDFAQAIAHVELFEFAREYELSQLVSWGN